MEIELGADVMGTVGKLGELDQVIADAHRDRVTAMVIKRGGVRAGRYVVPLGRVLRVEGGNVYVDLDEAAFEGKRGYAEAVFAENPDYVGTPSHDLEGPERGNLHYDVVIASGTQMQPKHFGYPGGEQLTPDIRDQPSICLGMDIFSGDGVKVGELAAMSVTAEDGSVAGITLKRPLVARRDPRVALPVAWVKDLGMDCIVLTASKDEVAALLERNPVT